MIIKLKNLGKIQKSTWPFFKCHFCILTILKQLILGLKKKFSTTIFHKKNLPFSLAPFILHLKHSNRAFEAFRWLQKARHVLAFCSHQNASNALFEGFRGKIKGATENGNFFYEKWLY